MFVYLFMFVWYFTVKVFGCTAKHFSFTVSNSYVVAMKLILFII